MIGFLYNSLFYNDCKETSVSFRLYLACMFFIKRSD